MEQSLSSTDNRQFIILEQACAHFPEKFIQEQSTISNVNLLNRTTHYNKDTFLTIACAHNHYTIIKNILENTNYTDDTINKVNKKKMNALHILCSKYCPYPYTITNVPSIKLLFESSRFLRSSINDCAYNNMNALHFACVFGNVPAVEYLLSNFYFTQESINAVDGLGKTALHIACSYLNFPTIKLLIESDLFTEQSANALDCTGQSVLYEVLIRSNDELIDYLMCSPKIWDSTIVYTYEYLVRGRGTGVPIPHETKQIRDAKQQRINTIRKHKRFVSIAIGNPHLIDSQTFRSIIQDIDDQIENTCVQMRELLHT